MSPSVHVALISGPPYDPLYDRLDAFTATTGIDVQIGFTGDHPSLNRHLAECEPVPYDLVSTHSKYAPSQRDFLAPLDGVLDAEVLDDFAPQSHDLASTASLALLSPAATPGSSARSTSWPRWEAPPSSRRTWFRTSTTKAGRGRSVCSAPFTQTP
jgi:hypothetical protein